MGRIFGLLQKGGHCEGSREDLCGGVRLRVRSNSCIRSGGTGGPPGSDERLRWNKGRLPWNAELVQGDHGPRRCRRRDRDRDRRRLGLE